MFDDQWIFEDRADAGRELAKRLEGYRDLNPIILGIPRGGVPVAFEIAMALNAPLDIAIARKLGAPFQPELGIGAIAPGGIRIVDEFFTSMIRIPDEEIETIIARETIEMERRLELFRNGTSAPILEGRVVILVDNGIATGVTTRAAARSVRLQKPAKLVLAVPVCAPETARNLRDEVDEFVCISTPTDFRAVGVWYQDFSQVSDDEVLAILEQARANQNAPSAAVS